MKTLTSRRSPVGLCALAGAVLMLTSIPAMCDRDDPLVVLMYGLEIEGKLSGFFTSVSGIGSESEVIVETIINPETGETIVRSSPGKLTWLDITLKRGVTSSLDMWEWRQEVVEGKIDEARTNCSIIGYNEVNEEVVRWNLDAAWPKRLEISSSDGGITNYMVEAVVLVHEGVLRVN